MKPALKGNFIKFLGTGHGNACGSRFCTAILLQLAGRRYLFDCGEPVCHSLKKLEVDFNSIERLFISHLHGDHVGGFHMLMQGMWLEKRKLPLPIHLPKEGIPVLQSIMKMGYLHESLTGFKVQWLPLRDEGRLDLGPVQVQSHHTTHLAQLKEMLQKRLKLPFEAFSFEIKAGRQRIALSMDCGMPEDLEPLVDNPLDLLVCELAHFDPEDLFCFLKERPIKRILLTHLAEPFWQHRNYIKKLADKHLGRGKVDFAQEMKVYPLA